jgi:hypothetical protein
MDRESFLDYYSRCITFDVRACEDAEFHVTYDNQIGINISMSLDKEVIIPSFVDFISTGSISIESIDLNNVTHIEPDAFYRCSKLREVIGMKLLTCGSFCFSQCNSLEKISLPSLESVDEYAFSDCYKLKEVNFPCLKTIGKYAFNHTGIREFSGERVEFVGKCAFNSTPLIILNVPNCKVLMDCKIAHANALLVRLGRGCKVYSSYETYKSLTEYTHYQNLHPEMKFNSIFHKLSTYQYYKSYYNGDKCVFYEDMDGYYTFVDALV